MAIEVVQWVYDNLPPELGATDMAVALSLAYHATRDGRHAFPSVRTIMRETRLAERTVRRALEVLREEKIIDVEADATHNMPTTYFFTQFVLGCTTGTPGVQDRQARGAPQAERGAPQAPKPSYNRPVTVDVPPSPPNGTSRWLAEVGKEKFEIIATYFSAANPQLDGPWLRDTVYRLEHDYPGISPGAITAAIRATLPKAEDAFSRQNTIRNPRAFVAKEIRSAVSEGSTR